MSLFVVPPPENNSPQALERHAWRQGYFCGVVASAVVAAIIVASVVAMK